MSDLEDSDISEITDDEITLTVKKPLKLKERVVDDDDDDDDDEGEIEDIDEDDDDDDDDEIGAVTKKNTLANTSISSKFPMEDDDNSDNSDDIEDDDIEDDEDDEYDETYLQKLSNSFSNNQLIDAHNEIKSINNEELLSLTKTVRDKDNIVIDDLHRTHPVLSKYEKTNILGKRVKQLNSGAEPFITTQLSDNYLIALMELKEKKLPFIIQRPLPNGGSEYWKVSDLENI